MTCPCGDPRPLEECCGPFIRGEAVPDTAEQLMRSRYTAYTLEEIDYILSTYVPEDGQEEADRESTEKWAKESEWLGLDIVDTVAGGPGDDEGVVEFIAKFRLQDTDAKHHERSVFKRVDGAWRYITGDMVKPKPVVRDKPKVGRNEPCPCGSGNKYKRCCGAA